MLSFWKDFILFPAGCFLITLVMGLSLILLIKRTQKSWKTKYRQPFYGNILRPPGWGCLKRREDALFDIVGILTLLPTLWAMVFILAVLGTRYAWVGAFIVAVPMTYRSIRVYQRQILNARTSYLGFLGECAVAEALAPMSGQGWRVFHDFVIETDKYTFNIDHIVVGSSGVFAIETKTFSKQREEQGRVDDKARIEGESIILPNGDKRYPMKQARGNALSLRNWLVEHGVAIDYVSPLVVIPGWNVHYCQNAAMEIRDPRNLPSYLIKERKKLTEEQSMKIADVIDAHCRSMNFDTVGF